ncbi:MAG: prepilin-type N-terminal cleavage/methylation domain-containing protein, partial [Opitutaceae bacterium]|nr:prepilin-type N-terminal cleavage/methylation domain-containing protein [Opitutaceae bacterium]
MKTESYPVQASPRAFTLVELLTVIAIIGILAGILIPTVSSVRVSARAARSLQQMRQIGMALELYANDNKFRYPAVSVSSSPWMRNPDFVACLPTRKSGSTEVADYEDSVFACPNAKSAGGSAKVRRAYSAAGSMFGISGATTATNTTKQRALSDIRTPKTAPLLFDAIPGSTGLCRDGTDWDRVSPDLANSTLTGNTYIDYRQKDKAHFLFCDYSVRAFTPAQAPAAFPDAATWTGLKSPGRGGGGAG